MILSEMEKTIICGELKISIDRYLKQIELEKEGLNEEIMLDYYQKRIDYLKEIVKKL